MSLYLIPQDKANHFVYGALCGLLSLAFYNYFGQGHRFFAPFTPVLAATALGISKEIADYISNQRAIAAGQAPTHGVEAGDAFATTLGGVVVGLANYL